MSHYGKRRRLANARGGSPATNFAVCLLALLIGVAIVVDIWVATAGLAAVFMLLLLRRADHPPIILFCLGYQWIFLFAGVSYRGFFGVYPSDYRAEHLNQGFLLLLGSLTVLSAGVACGMKVIQQHPAWQARRRNAVERSYSLNRLLILALVGSLFLWIPELDPRRISYAFSQVIYRLLEFRAAFLFLAFLMALRLRRGYGKTIIVATLVTLPLLTSGGAGFSQTIILFFIAFIAERRILLAPELLRARPVTVVGVVALACCLIAMAIVWNGALKGPWREKMREGQVSSSRVDRLQQFLGLAEQEVAEMEWREGTRTTARRVSDVPMMMGRVLDRVPSELPHQDGALSLRAVKHVTMPRFLFPNKADLGSDSVLVRAYAGIDAAGEESNTSVGLGYLIELYVDFGAWGMIAAAGFLGFVVGVLYRAIYLVCPSRELYHGLLSAIVLQHFTSLDGSLAKILGGLIMAFVVLGGIMYFFGRSIDGFLAGGRREPTRQSSLRRAA